MMRSENGRVLIDFSQEEFDLLLLILGYSFGDHMRKAAEQAAPFYAGETAIPASWWRLLNSINEGNPNWRPYIVDQGAQSSG